MTIDSPARLSIVADSPRAAAQALNQRALDLWPRLDRRILARCGGDARRIAKYVSRRTSLSVEAIQALIERTTTADEDDVRLWFG